MSHIFDRFAPTMQESQELQLAVLIDGDNIPYSNVRGMMEEIAKYGSPTFKRIYGDWTKPQLSGWKSVLLENAITPVQQYSYTSGKNATDSAMIIDAMDILYSGKVDGFCIVSSDSDFTRLATRLREARMKVIGIGAKKTPNPFIVACDKFIYLEIIPHAEDKSEDETDKGTTKKKSRKSIDQLKPRVIKLMANAISDAADEDGWAYMGDVGNMLLKRQPNFDPRNFGFPKLTPMIRSVNKFEVEDRPSGKARGKLIYVRVKE